MIDLSENRTAAGLMPKIERLWTLSAAKIPAVEAFFDAAHGAPVFTVEGRYTARGWTEWTQGFQFGSALLQFDATGDAAFLEAGRTATVERMAPQYARSRVRRKARARKHELPGPKPARFRKAVRDVRRHVRYQSYSNAIQLFPSGVRPQQAGRASGAGRISQRTRCSHPRCRQ